MYFKIFKIIKYIPIIQNIIPISTENNITISSYTGKWHQVATSRSTKLFGTGINYKNVTAEYDLEYSNDKNQTVLTVYNSGFDENNNFKNISGFSYVEGLSQTKRKLHFDKVPVDGNYWIVKLGPELNNKYEYVVISGPLTDWFGTRFSLYVLARNRKNYQLKYENQVKEWCKTNNYKYYWNRYIETK